MMKQGAFMFLEETFHRMPEKVALIFKDVTFSYGELYNQATLVACFFIRGIKNEETIALYADHSPFWLIAYLGILGAGCVCVPFSLRSSEENLIQQITCTRPRFIVVSEKFIPKWNLILPQLTYTPELISIEKLLQSASSDSYEGMGSIYSAIMFTSGTTGNQKGVQISHKVVEKATKNIITCLELKESDIYYAILPFHHSFGLGNVHAMLSVGGTIIISDAGTDLKKMLVDASAHGVTFFAATPLTLEHMTEYTPNEFSELKRCVRVICTNTSPMPPGVTKTILSVLPKTEFFTYYGLSEASRSTFHHFNHYPDKLTSVGKPAPHVVISIVDEEGKELATEKKGEILIRGPHVVDGYFKNEELTRDRFVDGWLHTGDIGYLDEEGFLYVVGRKNDIVDVYGERVNLQNVDDTLMAIDGVLDAGAFVMKESKREIVAVAVVVEQLFSGDHRGLESVIIEASKKKLDQHEVPSRVVFVKEIPRTDNGKIRRHTLQEKYGTI